MRITQRLQLIKLTVLFGILVSVALSHNLWAGQRWFPKVPFLDNYNGLQAPYDYFNLIGLIGLACLALFSESKIPTLFLILFSAYLCIDDQNRLQPWFFNYILILFVLLFYKKRVDEPNNYNTVFISIQVLVALIYIFSGIQKFNSFFVKDTFIWMLSPLESILPEKQLTLLHRIGGVVPYIEMGIGLGLLIKPLRFIAVPLVIIMHISILLLLGPLGKSYNHVIWPWNLIMIALNILLFANVKQERFFDVSILFKEVCFYCVLTLMLIFPLFSLNNKYDSYLSSSLYSANTHNCKLILSDKAYNQLPYYIRSFVTTNADYNILYIKNWALTELGSPCIPEYRTFEKVYESVIMLTRTDSENVKMEFTEREKILDF